MKFKKFNVLVKVVNHYYPRTTREALERMRETITEKGVVNAIMTNENSIGITADSPIPEPSNDETALREFRF